MILYYVYILKSNKVRPRVRVVVLDRVPTVKVFGVVQELLVFEHAGRGAEAKGDPIEDRINVIIVVGEKADVVLAAAGKEERPVHVAEEFGLEPNTVGHRVVLAKPIEHERGYGRRFVGATHGALDGAELERDGHVLAEGVDLVVDGQGRMAGRAHAVRAPSKLAEVGGLFKTNGAFFHEKKVVGLEREVQI
jgi:hypothetical protein